MARGSAASTASTARRSWLLVVGAVLAIAASLAPAGVRPVAAAGDALSITTAATYTIEPARRVVTVVVDLTATNNKPNTTAGGIVTRYFYQSARIAIQTEARNVRATAGGSRLTTRQSPADGYALLEVRFPGDLFYHRTTKLRITFELPGGAPRSKSDIRVGTAFAAFTAWAFGDSGSVRVVVPAGFDAAASGSALARSTVGGRTVFSASGINDVGTWYAVVNADRTAGLSTDRIDLPQGEHLVVRGWPEDAEWRRRVTALLRDGLPELVSLTGLDWPVTGDLQVFEVHTPLLEGYSGVFFENQDRIEISEDLDDLTIIHEVSHSWFNTELFQGRWLNEGFADTYAARVLDTIGSGGWAPNPVNRTDTAAVPLADWTTPGRITDTTTTARENYGYDASWTVIRTLLGEIGVDRMKAVLQAAKSGRIAYVGAGVPETAGPPVDWQRFLDLVDETGGSTTADDLFRQWVIGDDDRQAFDARAAARTAYRGLIDAGHGWLPPAYVRLPMSSWDFAEAGRRIPTAGAVLATRDQIAALVSPIGLDVPADLKGAYETATNSLAATQATADRELAAARALVDAQAVTTAPRGALATIGLIGAAPEVTLATARAAFQAGSADAGTLAEAASAEIARAAAVGQTRVAVAIAIILVAAFLVVLAAFLVRRRRAAARWGIVGFAAAAEEPGPYATLPDQSTGAGDEPERPPEPPPDDPPAEPPTPSADAPPGAPEEKDDTLTSDRQDG